MSKKIYHIEFNESPLGSYFAFIVRAESEDEALEIVARGYPTGSSSEVCWKEGFTIKDVTIGNTSEIIEASFNAA